jgi:hypothetical protein
VARPVIALALDPGVTTGLCVCFLNEDKLHVAPDERKFSLLGLFDYIRWFADYDSYVVYEDFQYRNQPRTGLDLTPVKMIGIIELCAQWYWEDEEAEFFKQTPAQGKGFYSDARLKAMGIYRTGKAHGRDATRHLMQWATFGAGSQYVDLQAVTIEMIEPAQIYDMIQQGGGHDSTG